jgi:tellurite resistance protein
MVLVSAADRNMTDTELRMMGDLIRGLPVFHDYDYELLPSTAASCADLLDSEDGLNQVLQLIKSSLPEHLKETAYALACDIAAADGRVRLEEVRMLEMMRDTLELDGLLTAAIERAACARFAKA